MRNRAEFDRTLNRALPKAAPGTPPVAPRPPRKVRAQTFICNEWPAYGIGLGGKMYLFQNGTLTLDEKDAIDELRRHKEFGRTIFEAGKVPADVELAHGSLPADPGARLDMLLAAAEHSGIGPKGLDEHRARLIPKPVRIISPRTTGVWGVGPAAKGAAPSAIERRGGVRPSERLELEE